jgi:hypothetical protein
VRMVHEVRVRQVRRVRAVPVHEVRGTGQARERLRT